jgi:hypothetical protein
MATDYVLQSLRSQELAEFTFVLQFGEVCLVLAQVPLRLPVINTPVAWIGFKSHVGFVAVPVILVVM